MKCFHYSFLVIRGLIKKNIIKLSIHKNDRPQSIVSNNDGIIISILFSLFVQLDNVTLSLLDVTLS